MAFDARPRRVEVENQIDGPRGDEQSVPSRPPVGVEEAKERNIELVMRR